eukprot:Mycagemm_TRINITY_DN10307_c2_g2::TRINITY_DN10307_c2_g2_i3::g.441::m.441 type:complete len:284 gc:universal TRINITY_DN10307_c2_g2_i3:1337-486(-)
MPLARPAAPATCPTLPASTTRTPERRALLAAICASPSAAPTASASTRQSTASWIPRSARTFLAGLSSATQPPVAASRPGTRTMSALWLLSSAASTLLALRLCAALWAPRSTALLSRSRPPLVRPARLPTTTSAMQAVASTVRARTSRSSTSHALMARPARTWLASLTPSLTACPTPAVLPTAPGPRAPMMLTSAPTSASCATPWRASTPRSAPSARQPPLPTTLRATTARSAPSVTSASASSRPTPTLARSLGWTTVSARATPPTAPSTTLASLVVASRVVAA